MSLLILISIVHLIKFKLRGFTYELNVVHNHYDVFYRVMVFTSTAVSVDGKKYWYRPSLDYLSEAGEIDAKKG